MKNYMKYFTLHPNRFQKYSIHVVKGYYLHRHYYTYSLKLHTKVIDGRLTIHQHNISFCLKGLYAHIHIHNIGTNVIDLLLEIVSRLVSPSFNFCCSLEKVLMGGKRNSRKSGNTSRNSTMSDDTIQNESPLHSTAHDLSMALSNEGKKFNSKNCKVYKNRTCAIFSEFMPNNEASSIDCDSNAINLSLFLYHPEHPNTVLTKDNIQSLKVYIQSCNKACIMDDNSEFVPLMTVHVFEEFLKIICEDAETKSWLLKHCFTSFPDFKFKVEFEKWYPGMMKKLIKCSVRIKKREHTINFKEFITFLNKQNKGLNITNADYYGKLELKDNKNILVFFGVTEEELGRIKERKGAVLFDVEKTIIMWPGFQEEQRENKKRKIESIG